MENFDTSSQKRCGGFGREMGRHIRETETLIVTYLKRRGQAELTVGIPWPSQMAHSDQVCEKFRTLLWTINLVGAATLKASLV